MNKIKLTGKLTACNKIDACKADGEIHNATIEIDHPDFSSLKEGDEVLVRRVIQKMSWGLYVPENIAAILPKEKIADPNETAKISISQWNRVVKYLTKVRKQITRLEDIVKLEKARV